MGDGLVVGVEIGVAVGAGGSSSLGVELGVEVSAGSSCVHAANNTAPRATGTNQDDLLLM